MIPPNRTRSTNPIIGIIGLVLFLIVAYYLISSVFWVLGLIAPVLFILTLIMDHKVVVDYGKWIVRLFKTKWYYGLGAGVLSVVGFTFVSAFLFGKVMFKKKIIKANMGGSMGEMFKDAAGEGGFTDYEEIDSEILVDDVELEREELDLGEIEENLNTLDDDNAYDDLFGNKK